MNRVLLSLAVALVLISPRFAWCQVVKKLPKVGDSVKAPWGAGGHLWDAEIVKSDGKKITVRWTVGGGEEKFLPAQIQFNGKPLKSAELQTKNRPLANAQDKERGPRTWSDATGKFKTDATFQALVDGKVELRKADGSLARLPLDKLSAEDQALAKKLAAAPEADPFASVEEPEEEMKSRPKLGARVGDDEEADEVKITEVDIADAKKIVLGVLENSPVPADAEPTLPPISMKRGIDLGPAQNDAWEDAKQLILEPTAKIGICAFAPRGANKETVRYQAFDLATGKVTGGDDMPAASLPIAISPSGKQVLGRTDKFGFGGSNRLDLWDFEAKEGFKHVASVRPYGDDKWNSDIAAAGWITDDLIYTMGNKGMFAVWQVPSFKPVYSFDAQRKTPPAFSGTRKYMALGVSQGVAIFDAQSGEPISMLQGDDQGENIAFSPDGKQLAMAGSRGVTVWDLATGTIVQEVFVPPMSVTSEEQSVRWIADDLIAVRGHGTITLVDMKRKVAAWRYSAHGEAVAFTGNRYWLAMENNKHWAIVHFEIPHAAIKAKIAAIPAEESLLLKPGAGIALAINTSLSQEDVQAIRDSIQKKLEANGMKVVDQSPVTLELTTEQGKTEQLSYRTFGSFNTQTVNVTPTLFKVAIKEDGKVHWSTGSRTGASYHIQLKDGQTLEQAIAEQAKPTATFFKNLSLPKTLARHPPNGVYGTTSVTPNGLQDQ